MVTASGYPAPTFTRRGRCRPGEFQHDDGVLSGTPAAGTGGVYPLTIGAVNGVLPNASQSFTLTVGTATRLLVPDGTSLQQTFAVPGDVVVCADGGAGQDLRDRCGDPSGDLSANAIGTLGVFAADGISAPAETRWTDGGERAATAGGGCRERWHPLRAPHGVADGGDAAEQTAGVRQGDAV